MKNISLLSSFLPLGAAVLVACSGASGSGGSAGADLAQASVKPLPKAGAALYDIVSMTGRSTCIWDARPGEGARGSVGDSMFVDFSPAQVLVTTGMQGTINVNDRSDGAVLFNAGKTFDDQQAIGSTGSYKVPPLGGGEYFGYEVDHMVSGAAQLVEKLGIYRDSEDGSLTFSYVDSTQSGSSCKLAPRQIGADLQDAGVLRFRVAKVSESSGNCVIQGIDSWGEIGDILSFDFRPTGVRIQDTGATGANEIPATDFQQVAFASGPATTPSTTATGTFATDSFTYQESYTTSGHTLLDATFVRSGNTMTYTSKRAPQMGPDSPDGTTATSTCTLVATTSACDNECVAP